MRQITADFICAQSHQFSHFALVCWASRMGLSPSLPSHMAFQRDVNCEFALISSIFNPSLCSSPPPFLPSFPAPPSSPTNTNMHKGNQTDTHTPVSQTSLVSASPRPPTSRCSLPFSSPPLSCPHPLLFPLRRSLSRPEATAGTCMAGCYVGAMTTVMNSTWCSRIQADVSLDTDLQMALTYLKNETLGGFLESI